MRVLVVEDDHVSEAIITAFLPESAEVEVVDNGTDAIEIHARALDDQHGFDLICLDVMLPGVDGAAVLRNIRDKEAAVGLPEDARAKVIMTTSVAERATVLEILQTGCDGYLVKPYDKTRLLEELERLALIPNIP